jgi:hypothetical protein
MTDLPSRQDHKVPSETSDRPPVRSTTTVPPSLQPKDGSAATSRLPVLPKHTPATTDPLSNPLSQPVSGPGSSSVREERNYVLAPEERENRTKDSANAKPNLTTSHAQDIVQHPRTPSESSLQRTYSSYRNRGYGSGAPNLPDTDDSRRRVGPFSGHSNDERDKPVPVQPLPVERRTGDGPQRTQRDQTKPNFEGDNSVGDMTSSPPDPDAGKSRDPDRPEKLVGNAVDARPLPAQTLSTSRSPRNYLIVRSSSNSDLTSPDADAGRSTVDEGKAQQRTGGGNTANSSGDRVRLESMSATEVVVYSCC